MTLFEMVKEIFPNAEMIHGLGDESAQFNWGSRMIAVSAEPGFVPGSADVYGVSMFELENEEIVSAEPIDVWKFDTATEAISFLEELTE